MPEVAPLLIDLQPEIVRRRCGPHFNLIDLEAAQSYYWRTHELLENTRPYDEWLVDRPPHTQPSTYYDLVGMAAGEIRQLAELFGFSTVAARPTLDEQRAWPN